MLIELAALISIFLPVNVLAQGGRGGRANVPPSGKAGAPIDVTGYWTAVITEDWHVRMLTAPKGDFGTGQPGTFPPSVGGTAANPANGGNIPFNAQGVKLAMAWDPAKDEAEKDLCKAYGAAGIMRQPVHLHIAWEDDRTLRMDIDYGTQTRLLHFKMPATAGQAAAKAEPPGESSPQGYSIAEWISVGGNRPDWPRGGNLKVVTTNLKPGYYWKNGMPYSGKAVMTERYRVSKEDNGDVWLNMWQMVDDPEYLREPFIVNYSFKKLPDGSRFRPTACSGR